MKISCQMADDLLPLYLEDSCSEDSQAALEAHVKSCPACRAKLERMRSGLPALSEPPDIPQLEELGRKVRRHRLRLAALVLLAALLAAFVLALTGLSVWEMRRPVCVPDVEEGTWNLTAETLETTAAEVGQYVLFTNYTQIRVEVRSEEGGTVLLRDASSGDAFIQTAQVDGGADTCTFKMLTSARRYIVDCGDLEGTAAVTVSEGRLVSFWGSLGRVLKELFRPL